MNASAHFLAAQSHDHALDLPPMAEARDVAGIAALLGENGGLKTGVVAIKLDQLRCIGKSGPA